MKSLLIAFVLALASLVLATSLVTAHQAHPQMHGTLHRF
jgi:hypothetical protein